jgi:hypothetical protein
MRHAARGKVSPKTATTLHPKQLSRAVNLLTLKNKNTILPQFQPKDRELSWL